MIDNQVKTKEPVTLSGWYENTDSSWTLYQWRNGELCADMTVKTAKDIPELVDEYGIAIC